jgi:hypothetical protein
VSLDLPVDLQTIDMYLKILLPAYQLNLEWQKSKSSIIDVLPGIIILKDQWETLNCAAQGRELCYFLVRFSLNIEIFLKSK